MTAIENGWTYELARLRAENARLRAALETAATSLTQAAYTLRKNWLTVAAQIYDSDAGQARAALAARNDRGG